MGKIVSKRGKKPAPAEKPSPNWPFPTHVPQRIKINPDGSWSFSDPYVPDEEVLRKTTDGVDVTHTQLEND